MAVSLFVGGLLWFGPRTPPAATATAPPLGQERDVVMPQPEVGLPEVDVPVVLPPQPPTLERSEVQAAYGRHVAVVLPHWRRVTQILGASSHPELQGISRDLAERLAAAQDDRAGDKTRQDLIHEERQLLNHLRQRYAGFDALAGPLDALDRAVTELDGG